MATSYWVVKSEPRKYPWQQFVREQRAQWDGVRNFEARKNMRQMRVGDLALFYHSTDGKEFVGIARVIREAYQDPTTTDDWSAVDIEPVCGLKLPVSLETVKVEPLLAGMALVKRSRLSVLPVLPEEFDRILALSETTLDV